MKLLFIAFFVLISSCSTMNASKNYRELSQDNSQQEDLSRFEREIFKGLYKLVQEHDSDYEAAMKTIEQDGYSFPLNSLSEGFRNSVVISTTITGGAVTAFIGMTLILNSNQLGWLSGSVGGSSAFVGSLMSYKGSGAIFRKDDRNEVNAQALRNQNKIKEIDEMKMKIVDQASIVFDLNLEEKSDLSKFVDKEYDDTFYENLKKDKNFKPKSISQIMLDNNIATNKVLIYKEFIRKHLNDLGNLSKEEIQRINEEYTYKNKLALMKATMEELAASLENIKNKDALKQALAEIDLINKSLNN